MRPSPIDPIQRARVIAALPQGAIPPDAPALAKMSLGGRGARLSWPPRPDHIYDHQSCSSVHRVARPLGDSACPPTSCRSSTKEEFAALVAHEIGHEYVWLEYRQAEQRHDHARIRELELRCDGVAVLTIRRLGLDANSSSGPIADARLVQQGTGSGRECEGLRVARRTHSVHRAVAKLQWVG